VIFEPESNTFSLAHTVTYKVVNGTWSDGTTDGKTENVASGSAPSGVPAGMVASEGHEGGSWGEDPAGVEITEATTFTYTFTEKKGEVPTVSVTAHVQRKGTLPARGCGTCRHAHRNPLANDIQVV
jgi:hypothetical protein